MVAAAMVFIQTIGLFSLATVAFDLVHYGLHRCTQSRFFILQRIGNMHQVHHDFFDHRLCFHDDVARPNIIYHALPEYLTQLFACFCALFVVDLLPALIAATILTGFFVFVLITQGKDANHIAFQRLPVAREWLFVHAPYHARHHIYPDNFFSSFVTLFDRIMGTACPFRGRTAVVTGPSGAFGCAMIGLLQKLGVKVIPLSVRLGELNDLKCQAAFKAADLLVLCHGTKNEDAMQVNCDLFVDLIERFKCVERDALTTPEVWAIGSESECHPSFGIPTIIRYARSKRAFARRAAAYYYDPQILYRHIVPSAFRSKMGPGLISGTSAARVALFWIRRGCRYVPVTYTGIAFINAAPFLIRAHLSMRSSQRRAV